MSYMRMIRKTIVLTPNKHWQQCAHLVPDALRPEDKSSWRKSSTASVSGFQKVISFSFKCFPEAVICPVFDCLQNANGVSVILEEYPWCKKMLSNLQTVSSSNSGWGDQTDTYPEMLVVLKETQSQSPEALKTMIVGGTVEPPLPPYQSSLFSGWLHWVERGKKTFQLLGH